MDHCDAIAASFRKVWPDIKLLNCWHHLSRKSREKKGLLNRKQEYNDAIKSQLDLLECSRSEGQFFALSNTIIGNWRARNLWFITASNKAGIIPNQNPIEAHSNSIKKVATGHIRAAILYVLAAALPKILIYCGGDGSMIPIRSIAPGPIKEYIYVAATALCKSEITTFATKEKRSTQLPKFDDYYVVNDENLYGLKVTKVRTTKYTKSLNGILHVEDKIRLIRNRFKCDCKMFYQTGWLCCHVLASRASSRPKKPCLSRDGLLQSEYTVGALTTTLIEKHANVINWSMLQLKPGTVRSKAGIMPRYWDVYIRKRQDKVTMAMEQLSHAIDYSFRMGQHILPKK
ncbi:hypothetical protein PHMEG_0006460 [Phytophthora megakarya]|uniref:SWIM-type domain-containing protein n=1 Tax=Phytophthora megakarya TaxID=4795 RepID=A0A225WNS2_9STRA|nr:hypothetical protein PHMEG_0006460 [Phytophthora megakarya]